MIVDGYCIPGTERDTGLSVDRLLETMDRAGIDRAVIAPEDREIVIHNREGNRRLAKLAGDHPDRFIAACSINPWQGQRGIELLGEAVAEGARMLILAPALQGFVLGDPIADGLLEEAVAQRVPVYVHTGPHSAATPSQLVLLAMRFPQVQFIMGHCGATDYSHDVGAVLKCDLSNLWYDISLARPWAAADLVKKGYGGRTIYSSGSPRNDTLVELAELERDLPRKSHPDLYGGNLMNLLSLSSS
jgi:uncharacterized protein